MTYQLCKANWLRIITISALALIIISGINSVEAQSSAQEEIASPNFSEQELHNLMTTLDDLRDQTNSNSNLAEYEKSIRLYYYDRVTEWLKKDVPVQGATRKAILPTSDYSEHFVNGENVDLRKLADETEQELH